ncbi:MAG: DUF411 domain-containing protein [Thiobacillus sp.]|jgi:hypothetical protein|uniref:DUF411 domain-containing protein n=1 Tax=Thiobacillus sp. TaxID=924 RepID=UPI0028957997|nr:DUF411 domain-containing protein [Thiobacillus sp.]MDT3706257.1 DUF411 domain-containing protein [Thiobacillus sp.]
MKNLVASLLIGSLAQASWAAPASPVIDIYKSPTCGCCNKWIDHLKANGFTVTSHDTDNVAQHKYRLGVPPGYGSCHTAEVGGYVIEGHVPTREIKRLLKEKPRARGLVVPGMPIGSPGMETGDHKDPYDVFLVNRNGSTRTYAKY